MKRPPVFERIAYLVRLTYDAPVSEADVAALRRSVGELDADITGQDGWLGATVRVPAGDARQAVGIAVEALAFGARASGMNLGRLRTAEAAPGP
jgi:hypothetical protein